MKPIRHLLPVLFLLMALPSWAQTAPGNDEGMGMFLMTLLFLFFSIAAGVAIATIIIAALVFGFFFILTAAGILSSSIAIGLYNRSFTAGFRSFLFMTFIPAGCVLGVIITLAADYFLQLSYSKTQLFITGLSGGFFTGLVAAFTTAGILKAAFNYVVRRLKLVN